MQNNFKIDGDTLIVYSRKHNQEMLFSVEDADMVKEHTWFISQRYVRTNITVATKRSRTMLAHRLLMNPSDTMQVDHINGVRHDNRRSNLRIVTNQENQHNHRSAKGYGWHKKNRRYQAYIKLNNKCVYLGNFKTEVEARDAYVAAKKIYHPSAPTS
jgi:hypothetical protein